MRVAFLFFCTSLCFAQSLSAQKAKPKQPALPVFSFMGDDTETITKRTELNGHSCTSKGPLLECADYSISKIADAPILWINISYNNGLLYRVMGATNYTRFSTLLDAFTVKYGKPTLTTEKWQAKNGGVFDNPVARWRFRGGFLELESRGMKVDEPMFTFVSSANAPPPEKPKIDF